jgi:hypothetical protein
MNKLQLAELFQRRVGELRAKNPQEAQLLGEELQDWASGVAPFTGAALVSLWDIIYSQIQPIAKRQKISEEQVINDLFASGLADSLMLLLQLG